MLNSIKIIPLLSLLIAAFPVAANEQQTSQYSAVVLMYHHIGDNRYPSTNIRLEQFEAHLNFLEQQQFNIWPLEKIITQLRGSNPVPDKTIAITMDDAYRSVFSEAFPRLKQRNWPFTVFVSTDYIDKKYSNYMSWEQMREMTAHGVSFGNHSANHTHLIRQHKEETQEEWQARIRQDLQKAQQRLETELETTIPFLAYPFGEYNTKLVEIVSDLGLTGMGQHSGAIGPDSDFSSLARFPINEAFGDLEGFSSKALSLAMPISEVSPSNPQTTNTKPTLSITLKPSDMQTNQLSCYVSSQGRVEVNWLNNEKTRFSVQAENDLPAGRSRYNCTAPSKKDGERFYWFSQLWIRPDGVETEN